MTDHHAPHFVPAMGRRWLLPLYDPLVRLFRVGPLHRWLLAEARLRSGERVLEIGCGTGNLALLAKRLQPRAEVVGIDPDADALARARSKAARRSLTVQLDHGYAERLPYPDASFDHVLSSLMLHHLSPEHRAEALREARRTLRPGGALHVLDFGPSTGGHQGLVARLTHRCPRLHDNLRDGIPAALREAGFADATEVGQKSTRWLADVAYVRATR